ncbi:MAG: acireductone synthase [Candidatus Eremiobacteraeota bacterium]|nr:acireductone synthase [Candidatus Eremiobacteraeota bacterium]
MTLRFRAQAILTDIEGTTGSSAFVHEALFPYADAHLDEFVARHADEPKVAAALARAAQEAGLDANDRMSIVAQLHAWIAEDAKITPLKTLQGYIWADGYGEGELAGHVYEDAARNLRKWHDEGFSLYVYSSGSIAAQQLIFGHSTAGDLRPLFSGYFDTTIGGKRERASYARIVRDIGTNAGDVLFLSDIEAELDAAREAGLQTAQLVRAQDETKPSRRHDWVNDFDELDLRGVSPG